MPRSTRPLGSQPVAVIRCSGLMRAPPACGPLPWRIGMESEKVLPWRTSPAARRRTAGVVEVRRGLPAVAPEELARLVAVLQAEGGGDGHGLVVDELAKRL